MGRQEVRPGVAPTGTYPQSSVTNTRAANYQNVQRQPGSVGGGGTLGAATSYSSGGGVLGTSTSSAPPQEPVDPYAGLRNEISSGWDSYLGTLDDQLYGFEGKRASQEGIASSQYNQGVNTLDLQKTQGLQSLGSESMRVDQNQSKNLRDLSSNLKNSFMAGNVYLGSKGAGDSSAANQYAFALTKMGSQGRGDIMNNTANIKADIAGRETNLNNIYNTEKNNLAEGLRQVTLGISQWYANAVNTIKQQKAQGMLSKSQDLQSLTKDILNQAMSQLANAQQQVQQRQAGLDSWALSNSKTLGELRTNMTAVASPQYQLPQAQAIAGAPQYTSGGNMYIPSGYGNNSEEKRTSIFG